MSSDTSFDPIAALNLVDCGKVNQTHGRLEDAFARAVGNKQKRLAALHIDSHTDAYPYGPAEKYNSATQFTHIADGIGGVIDGVAPGDAGVADAAHRGGCRRGSGGLTSN